jgi:hypothetical protein
MAGIKVSKNVILPKLDRVRDTEMKKVLEQLFKVIQDINSNNYNDLTYIEKRVYDLEHP